MCARSISAVCNLRRFSVLLAALDAADVPPPESRELFRATAACLHLGAIEFDSIEPSSGDAQVCRGGVVCSNHGGGVRSARKSSGGLSSCYACTKRFAPDRARAAADVSPTRLHLWSSCAFATGCSQPRTVVTEATEKALVTASELLGCECESLRRALTCKQIKPSKRANTP